MIDSHNVNIFEILRWATSSHVEMKVYNKLISLIVENMLFSENIIPTEVIKEMSIFKKYDEKKAG